MTRARAGGTGVEAFGSKTRALVVQGLDWKGRSTGTWWGVRPMMVQGEPFDTWAEAMAYVSGGNQVTEKLGDERLKELQELAASTNAGGASNASSQNEER